MKDSLIRFWNKIKLRNKPSYPFFILSILLGLILLNTLGAILALAVAWTFERLVPPSPKVPGGVMRNRTKNLLNIFAVTILLRMLYFFIQADELDRMNSVGWAVGVPTEWAIGSSSGFNSSISFFSIFISIWLFVQASYAKRCGKYYWRMIFICFGVASLPLMHRRIQVGSAPINLRGR